VLRPSRGRHELVAPPFERAGRQVGLRGQVFLDPHDSANLPPLDRVALFMSGGQGEFAHTRARARESRDRTVPTGTPSAAAASS
jgi:hypothetical protein